MREEYELDLVLVIVPTFNRSKYLIEAMDSVFQQTYRPIELLVVDDGSTDDTAEVLAKWISNHQNDPTFQIIFYRQKNQGACAARNHGLMLSKGEFVQLLDDDDIMYPQKITKQVKYLRDHPEIDIVACNLDYLSANLQYITKSNLRGPHADEPFHHYIIRQDIMNFAPVYRRQVLLNVEGWGVGLPCGQDTDLIAGLAISGARFTVTHDSLGGVRCHNNGRLTDAVRFSRSKEARYYDVDLFKRIMSYAESMDKADNTFRDLVAVRLLETSRVYFRRFMPTRAQLCLRQAHQFSPKSSTLIYRFYKSTLGMIIACPIEFILWNASRVKRLLHRLARHITF